MEEAAGGEASLATKGLGCSSVAVAGVGVDYTHLLAPRSAESLAIGDEVGPLARTATPFDVYDQQEGVMSFLVPGGGLELPREIGRVAAEIGVLDTGTPVTIPDENGTGVARPLYRVLELLGVLARRPAVDC
jgi:hypothetical protein